MDLSPEYIEMCKKAEEIQQIKSFECGNWFREIYSDEPRIKCQGSHTSEVHEEDENLIWLPRQDQLQDLILSDESLSEIETDTDRRFFKDFVHYFNIWGLLALFNRSLDDLANPYPDNYPKHDFNSAEQLWLAFVMQFKFNKIWNNSEWK